MSDGYLSTLKQQDQWVCWRYECREDECGTSGLDATADECPECGGDKTKPPLSPVEGEWYGRSNDPDTWASYETAREYARENDMEGVGFALSAEDMYVGVDLDGCRDPETGELEPWADDIVTRLDTYTEVSPSGMGLRAFVLGVLPDGSRRETQERTLEALSGVDKNAEVEIYEKGRYMTFTGEKLDGTPDDIQQRPQEVKAIHADYVAEDNENEDLGEFDGPDGDTTPESADVDLTDEQVIEKAKDAANGEKFEKLYRGYDGYHNDDTSTADKAFCQMLAFWTGGDRRQMDRIFRNSGRMRDKWTDVHSADGDTYGEMTIDAALKDQTEYYNPQNDNSENKIDCECGQSAYRTNKDELTDDVLTDLGAGDGHRTDYVCPDCGRKARVLTLDGEKEREEWETTADRDDRDDSAQTLADVADSPESESVSETSSSSYDWSYVRSMYEEETKGHGRRFAADALEKQASWMYVMESETLWVYDEEKGYFNPWGEERVAQTLERNLGTNFSRTEAQEVSARLAARNQTHREDLNARNRQENLVCVGNGVLNVETGELEDHSPDYQFTRGIPYDYKPDAVPERTLRFLRDVTKRDADMWTLLQQLGHGLLPGHPFKAFVVMFGPGDNGKSAVGRLFRRFVGDENAASVELRDFREDDFATGDLPGKMINVGDDLSGKKVRDVSMLKRLTGGDTLRANEKHKATFDFQNEAAMFFSGNEPPVFEEQTDALKGRLYPIHMPYRFTQESGDGNKDADPHLVDKIVSDAEEMSGLLNLAVQGAQDLIESGGQFAMPESPQERMELYEAASDPIRRFVMDYLEQGSPDDMVLKNDAYDVYSAMCRAEDERAADSRTFKTEVSQQAIVDVESGRTQKLKDSDEQETCWKYLRFNADAVEHMSERLQERYFPDDELTDTDDDDDGNDDETAAYGAQTVARAAEDATGYPTVTVDVVRVERPDSPTAPALKATVKDESSAIDVVSWNDDTVLEEGETVVIKNGKLSEYQMSMQLEIDDAITEVEQIQPGVGHTKPSASESVQNTVDAAATDGGQLKEQDDSAESDESDVSEEFDQIKANVAKVVLHRVSGDETHVGEVAGLLMSSNTEYDPEEVGKALDKLSEEGRVVAKAGGDRYELL